jgi:tetratricopeptide (TPR) repeat protein
MRWKAAGAMLLVAAIVVGAALVLSRYREERAQRSREQNLALLEEAYQASEADRMAALAEALLAEGDRCPNPERVLYLKARAAHQLNRPDEVAVWQMLLDRYPESPYAAEALLILGRSAVEQGEADKARTYLKALLEKVPSGPQADEALLALARLEEESGNQEAAREQYERIVAGNPDSTVRKKTLERLSGMNRSALFSPGENEFNQLYTVVLGDKLITIAGKFDTTVDLLEGLNPGVDVLHEGQILTVPRPGGLRIVVDKAELLLSVYSNREGTQGRFLICYSIGLPEHEDRKLSGEYVVGKVKNVYSPREDGTYGTLGSRYIELELGKSGESTRVAFHGTNDPSDVGRVGGVNSIRLRNSDVEELYPLARSGTPVTVR